MKFIIFIFLMLSSAICQAQCAMCRATVENSISEGNNNFAASLNTGILYLFLMPYIVGAVVIWLWLRESKKNEGKNKIRIRNIG